MQNRGRSRVYHYWKPSIEDDLWKHWIVEKEWDPPISPQVWNELSSELQKRQILYDASVDKIQWGQNPARHFNMKEAYRYIALYDQLQPEPKWNSLWDKRHWPKISIFLWLVIHMKILTWNNVKKKRFIEPSKCYLCQQKQETSNHLLNECPYVNKLWHWVNLGMETRPGHIMLATLEGKKHKIILGNRIIGGNHPL